MGGDMGAPSQQRPCCSWRRDHHVRVAMEGMLGGWRVRRGDGGGRRFEGLGRGGEVVLYWQYVARKAMEYCSWWMVDGKWLEYQRS